MFKYSLLTLLTAGVLSMSAASHAEMWSCKYDGSWVMHDKSDNGSIKWDVDWTSSGNGWKIYGDYTDKYGDSLLDGSCKGGASGRCALKQTYNSGEFDGEVFNWAGSYTEKRINDTRVVNQFKGTWGKTGNSDGGTWQAKAVCDLTGE